MCTLTVRDFRQNLSRSLDRVDRGEDVVISRGNDHYIIAKVKMAPVITPELQARLDAARNEYAEGKFTTLHSHEEIDQWLDSL